LLVGRGRVVRGAPKYGPGDEDVWLLVVGLVILVLWRVFG
jgi:hypothetical protein